jgi:purine nucleoside phosphorylase
VALRDVPEVLFANVGGSGSWGYRFPEGVFDADPDPAQGAPGTRPQAGWGAPARNGSPLQVRKLEGGLVFETSYGDSPPFGLYELSDRRNGLSRRFLRVWFHGQQPGVQQDTPEDPYATTPMRSIEKVFDVLKRAGTKFILVDASVGGVNRLLDPWDLVITHDFYDDMKRVPRVAGGGFFSLRNPYCPHLRAKLFEAAGRNLGRYTALAQRVSGEPVQPKIVRRGVYVCPDGPWFESPAQIADYQHRGFDVVGKTVVPEVQIARALGAHFGSINPVVNPAEGLADPDSGRVWDWTSGDLFRIYDHYGPVISAIVLEAMAAIDPENPGCRCVEFGPQPAARSYGQFIER